MEKLKWYQCNMFCKADMTLFYLVENQLRLGGAALTLGAKQSGVEREKYN
jgi:hypothetical protein